MKSPRKKKAAQRAPGPLAEAWRHRPVAEALLLDLDRKPYLGFASERAHLQDLILRTVERGESNSVLVLGSVGVGKSACLAQVLADLQRARPGLGPMGPAEALLVHLSGWLQVDDRLALKEITRQLKLENVVGEKVFGSFADHLDFLLASLKAGNQQSSKPVIFVLDQFDLFCEHHNQTLLYNLFDTAQSRAVPMIIVGLTPRIDVVETMEKRVKSRFCHRSIHLNNPTSLNQYLEYFQHFLAPNEGNPENFWKRHLKETFLASDSAGRKFLKELYDIDSSIANLKMLVKEALFQFSMDSEADELGLGHFETAFKILNPGFDEEVLNGLSVLDLAMAVAAKNTGSQRTEPHINFEMVFHAFKAFVHRKCSMLSFDRSVIMKSWENLIHLEVLRPLDHGAKVQNEYKDYILDVLDSDLVRVVEKASGVPLDLREWAKTGFHEQDC
eukprot:maker-scaffold22_size673200-snap-gene-3.26 protein:Tk12681 transcript:maker-scaffold22_size673200-snap-gene-3.26-mRNA-1 annotation:"origin recognition complex subunit 4"